MGAKKREEVHRYAAAHAEALKRWIEEHPAPPATAPRPELERYAKSVPIGLLKDVLAELDRSAATGNPEAMNRSCFACGHRIGGHVKGAGCPCCARGLRIVPKGTDLIEAARAEKEGVPRWRWP